MHQNSLIGLPENAVFCRFWDNECVAYDRLRGSTHFVDGVGAEIFKAVSEKIVTRYDILQHVLNAFDFPVDFDTKAFLDNLLLEYRNLGLLQISEDGSE